MDKAKEVISEGRAARELLRNLKPYTDKLMEDYILTWKRHAGTSEGREDLHRKVVLLEDIEREIRKVVQDGMIAEQVVKASKVTRDG